LRPTPDIPRPGPGRRAALLSVGARGMTLIEILLVVAIMASAMGLATMSFSNLSNARMKAQTLRLAGALRYVYGRAAINGVRYQLTLNPGGAALSLECSVTNVPVTVVDDEVKRVERRVDDAEANPFGISSSGGLRGCEDPVLKDFSLKDDVVVDRVLTTHDKSPVNSGTATIGFFPDGFVERSIIWLRNDAGAMSTLMLDPLSGRVRVVSGDAEIPKDFFEVEEDR
jgi:prepilin-type N-terminal cleavage/methylation domain-containing protein